MTTKEINFWANYKLPKKKKITLQTGVKITQDKNGNIKSLVSPYDEPKNYGEQCVDTLNTLFKSFNNVR